MKRSTNVFALILMISSIVLLIILQALWIRSSYTSELLDLRKQANTIFKNTVFQLRDSLFFTTILPELDTVHHNFHELGLQKVGTAADTIFKKEKSSMVRVFISTDDKDDSLVAALKPLTQKFRRMERDGKQNFSIRIAADSINLDSLRFHFKNNLNAENVIAFAAVDEIKFARKRFRGVPPPFPPEVMEQGEHQLTQKQPSIFSDSLFLEPVRLNRIRLYSASLSKVRISIIKKITPQILFSVFLTLITSAAFILLYRSIRSQQRLMELKNDFISNMTHELKTPIATVSVALEALKSFKGIDNPKLTAEYLDIAQHELNRLTLLTDKVLKTTLFENQGVEFQPEPVDLERIITQVLQAMKLVFEKHKATFSFEKEGESFIVNGSEVHLTNVIYNLLDNALKYSSENPILSISLRHHQNIVSVSVKDNGIGIASEFQKKVFEKFFRVPTGDVHNTKGYGLGLNYVDNVVKSHKGKIEVKSEEGKGSTFIITLPTGTLTHG